MKIIELLRWTVMLFVVFGGVFCTTTAAFAKPEASILAKRRINLAGRQRMLTQRITAASCFIATDVDRSKHIRMLAISYERFSATHRSLIEGNRELGLESEINANIVVALSRTDDLWAKIQPKILNILNEKVENGDADLASLNAMELELLGRVDSAAMMIAKTYGEDLPELPMILATTIDLASRQRMFTQKAVKDFCLINAGVDVDDSRADLVTTLNFFNLTLDALIDGYPGVVLAAPNDDIRAKLVGAKEMWQPANEVLQAVAGGRDITDQDLQIITTDVEKVLKTLSRTVRMYESVKDAQ